MTLRTHLRQAAVTGATLAVAAVFTAGCNSLNSGSSAAGVSGSVSVSASGAASGPGSVAGSAAAGSSPAASAASAASTATEAEGTGSDCTTPVLKITTGNDAGGGTAGSNYSYIYFTNTGTIPCRIEGYPGVSLTSASGAQIGAAATRDPSSTAQEVTLAPGATAKAQLRMTDYGVYPASQCTRTTPAYLKVYPPNNTTATLTPFTGTTCSNPAIKMLQVGTLTTGTTPAN
jgi:hypothetical protein